MKKDIKVGPYLSPMPVQLLGTYNEDGSPDLMNAAWGGILDNDLLVLSLDSTHKTAENIEKRKAFTLSLPDASILKQADYVGIVSYKREPRKIAKSGLTMVASKKVDAPYPNECPIVFECEVAKTSDDEYGYLVYGRIKGILVEESSLGENGKPDLGKLRLLSFDPFSNCYRVVGEEEGKAFVSGISLK